jgi:hypothetical protein
LGLPKRNDYPERLRLGELPKLKSEVVERRAEKLTSASPLTLNGLAELVYYHDAELLSMDKFNQCLSTALGEEIAPLLTSQDEQQRRLALAMILEKAKLTKRK